VSALCWPCRRRRRRRIRNRRHASTAALTTSFGIGITGASASPILKLLTASRVMPQITFDLDDDSYDKLTQLAEKKGRKIEDSLPEILVEPISRHYFSEFTASIDYFEGRSPVTDEEAEVARRFVLSQIAASAIPLPRPEAVIYGLCLAAHDLALKLCEDARYKYPDQHAD
jgi:hypothetical protein